MYTCPIEMEDVRYNAATQSFEAAVTLHDNSTVRSYACAIQGPLSMSFENAAKALSKQAIRHHQERGGLFSEVGLSTLGKQVRRPASRTTQWLYDLINLPERSAA